MAVPQTRKSGVGVPARQLTRARYDRIIKATRGGMSISASATLAGIPPQTLRNWLTLGETQLEGKYRLLYEGYMEARASLNEEATSEVLNIMRESKSDQTRLRAAQLVLERIIAEEWAPKGGGGSSVVVNVGTAQPPPQVIMDDELVSMSIEERAAAIQKMQGLLLQEGVDTIDALRPEDVGVPVPPQLTDRELQDIDSAAERDAAPWPEE